MKKLVSLMMMMVSVLGVSCNAKNELPTSVKTFITSNFPSTKITKIDRDVKANGIEYEVELNNGVELDFGVNNEWESIDCEKSTLSVPDNVIAKPIRTYVATTYPGRKIVEVDRKPYGCEVKLDNRVELMFDSIGRFLGVDR
jgi:hypothetical protein